VLPVHAAGKVPGHLPGGTDPEADKKERRLLDEQFRMVQQGLQLEETRTVALQLSEEVEAKINARLLDANITLQDRIKYIGMLHTLEMDTVTLFDKQLQRAVAASKIDATRITAVQQLLDLEAEYDMMSRRPGGLTPEQEEARQKRLHDIHLAIAAANTEELRQTIQNLGLYDDETVKLYGILTVMRQIAVLRSAAKTKEDMDAIDALERSSKAALKPFGAVQEVAGAFDMVVTGAASGSEALKMLQSDAMLTHKILMAVGKGLGKNMLIELAQIAKGKMLENIAWALEDIGLAFLGHPGAGPGAAAHFKAAAAWGLVAGVAGGVGGGGGGGAGSGGAGAASMAGTSVAATQTAPAPITNIYIDGVDPLNTSHQALIGDTFQQAVERGIVNIFPGALAPAPLRG
jgi:hypothetical protein